MPQVRIIAKNFMDMVASLPAIKLDKLYENAFTAGQAALKAASCKVTKHEKACLDNQHAFIPFAFDTFGFLASEAVELLKRVQRVMHGNVTTPRSLNVVFKRLSFAIQKGLAAQLVARLPVVGVSLPPLAKKYVLQLLYIDVPVTASSLQEWVLADGASKHRVAVDRLIQLRVFTETVDRKKEATYRLNPMFQMNLREHIVHGGVLPREPMAANITVRLPSLDELDNYAAQQWECFLLHLINSAEAEVRTKSISASMMKVFQRGLLSQRDREGALLTESGFQFLLMDTNAQLWYIIREYISNSEDRGVDSADLISFLLELSFHVTGEAYNINTLDDVQRTTVKDLADLGLIKLQQGRKDSWFIPTKLATNLSISLSDASSRKQGYVVVETNFRLYAYSTSKLHCEILKLFSRVEYQLPNLIVGSITKENLYKAFANGITADQIISFLQQNAHPRVAERVPSVPENVTDQIRLWESDLNRVEMTPAHFLDDFPSRDVFEAACDFAREYSSLLWEDSKKMRLIVKTEMYAHMKEFLNNQK